MFPFDILLSLKNTVKADNKWLQPHLIRIRQLSNIKITIARNCSWTNKLKTTLPSLLLRQTFLSVMSMIRPPTPPRLRSHPLTHSVASAAGRQLSTTFPKQGMSSSIHLLRFSVFQNWHFNSQSKQPHVLRLRDSGQIRIKFFGRVRKEQIPQFVSPYLNDSALQCASFRLRIKNPSIPRWLAGKTEGVG